MNDPLVNRHNTMQSRVKLYNKTTNTNVGSEITSPSEHQKRVIINDVTDDTKHTLENSQVLDYDYHQQQMLCERLCTPTKASENARYKAANDESRMGKEWKLKKKYNPPSLNLMKPTIADVQRRW